MKIQHKKLGIDFELPEILQKDLETYEQELQPLVDNIKGIQISTYSGAVLRAAIKVGWIDGMKPEEVSGMNPGAVAFIANGISQHILEAREIPPE